MVWYSHLLKHFPQFVVIHTIKGFSVVNEAESDVFFLKFSCFFDDSLDVGNLTFGSSAFSKSSLNIWKFLVQVLFSYHIDSPRTLKGISDQFKTFIFYQFSSVTQSCPILCDPMNRSTPGLPVHHQLPEFT